MEPSPLRTTTESTDSGDGATATTVFIVDDHAGYRAAASAVVGATPGFALSGSASSTAGTLDSLARLPKPPDLVLMDVNLAGESGIEAARAVVAAHPTTKIVLVSTLRADELPPGFESCGAAGYLPKLQLSTATLAQVWAGAYDWAS